MMGEVQLNSYEDEALSKTDEADSWLGGRIAIWAQSPKPAYTLETQRYAQPSRCIPLLRPGKDLIIVPGSHEGTREAWEFYRDTLGLDDEQAVWTSGSLYNMDDDVDDHVVRQLIEAIERQPDAKFLLIPYCPTPNFNRWAQPLQAEMGADKLAIFCESQEWIEKYGDKGILHRHMKTLEEPSVIELIDPSIKVPRGFVCSTKNELLGARKLLAETKVCIKPLAGATGVGILLDVTDEQLETYEFPLGPVNLEELLQLDRDADGEAISPARACHSDPGEVQEDTCFECWPRSQALNQTGSTSSENVHNASPPPTLYFENPGGLVATKVMSRSFLR